MISAKPLESGPIGGPESPIRPQHPSFPPFHLVPGVSNFRDIGGWPITSTTTPKHVRRGIVFRGSDTTRITSAGIATLQDLNVTTDFDLRSAQQIVATGGFKDMSEHGIQRIWSPVFGEKEYTEEKAKERYEMYASEDSSQIVTAFIEILTSGAPMMHTVLSHLLSITTPLSSKVSSLSSAKPPALFLHCTTGNNRTGIFIALLLSLLNVPAHLIALEYTLSELGLAPTRHINIDRLLKKGAFSEYGVEGARRKCERMVGARRESIEALLVEVERRWGGAEGYFRGIVGLIDGEIEAVKECLVEEGEGSIPDAGDGKE